MRRVAARSVRRVAVPAYPTKLDVLAEPELLARHVPPAWLAKAEVAGALSAFLAVNAAGCADKAKSSQPRVDPRLANAAIVAPVFEHGDGRGATGCIVVSPPAFLSEEEALSIIREELGPYGLHFTRDKVELPQVRIPTRFDQETEDQLRKEYGSDLDAACRRNGKTLTLDLEDPARGVAVKFVSEREYFDLGGRSSFSSVDDYDFRELAQFVSQHVQAHAKGIYFAAFYDPACERAFAEDWLALVEGRTSLRSWEAQEKAAQEEAKELLRQQVKDFADWLKGQGVI